MSVLPEPLPTTTVQTEWTVRVIKRMRNDDSMKESTIHKKKKKLVVTFPQMCVNAHVPCSPRQALVLSVWNMFVSFWVDVLLG